MRFATTLLSLAALVGLPLALAGAPIKNANVKSSLVVPNSYIVTYKKNADPVKRKKHEAEVNKQAKKCNKAGIVRTICINGGLEAYVVEISPSEIGIVTKSDLVDYVEKDTYIKTSAVAAPLEKRAFTTQKKAPWGLGRISHKALGSADYYYDQTAGSKVRVYVVDSGILLSHEEFEGRAVWGANFVSGTKNADEFGHGTHVAGIIGGKTYGVAKKATLVAVKVADKNGAGTMSTLLAGINWVVADAKAKGVAKKAVVNMSVGGGYTASINAAVLAATNAGLTVVVAAGNDNGKASGYSPASAPSAITVGAIDGLDYRAGVSNYGSLVDIFAPGVSVLSSYIGTNSAVTYLSGTSMACPHVAGLAAYFIAKEGLSGSTAVTKRILGASITGIVNDAMGSPSRVAYNAGGL
ncbi:peptidase S8/S53 domain-containing protein [Apodospora peruviana]|uniref:Peptidase S8/S53 domain-containing protein n=1 Tax=Apodospora peruviana TaxID=516989 RepID=A0AAE0HV81_9PEZI|nr:peptidase S8/S53 domain-containing protein [Apodospora peruviana]